MTDTQSDKSPKGIVVCLKLLPFLAVGLALLFFVFKRYVISDYKIGNVAYVYQNNELSDTIDLSVDGTYTFYDPKGGHNTIVVENGYIYVSDADCNGKDCIKKGHINKVNDSIVCLPHRLSIVVNKR